MELYSKRKKAAENPPTAFRFDLPLEFKNQVWFIWREALGFVQSTHIQSPYTITMHSFESIRQDLICEVYSQINQTLCDEHGITGLPGTGPCDALFQWLLQAETDIALDIIQVSFSTIQRLSSYFENVVQPSLNANDAVLKLNRRFQEHAIGYRFELGRIIRIDSEFLNSEVTEPALRLLFQQGYEGALSEFQLAHEHYREGKSRYDDCLTNCLKALESVLKTICRRRNWNYKETDGAAKLVGIVLGNGLIPSYLQSHFDGLRATLESGVPTIRNREGGHGSGEYPNYVPEYLVAYQLHLTASAIFMLVRANEIYGKKP